MKISVIAHSMRVAGGKSVALNLISAMLRAPFDNEFQVFAPHDSDFESLPDASPMQLNLIDEKPSLVSRAWFDGVELPKRVRSWHPDVVFALGNFGLMKPPAPQAVLFHKAHFVYPELILPRLTPQQIVRNRLIEWQLRRSLKATGLVFCQTNTIATRFRETFEYPGRVRILPNAVSKMAQSETDAHSVSSRIGTVNADLKLLALARYYGHKNLDSIVDTFVRFRTELDGVVCFLTIEPGEHPGSAALLERIKAENLASSVINLGPLAQHELGAVFRSVDALILPTLLESSSGSYLEAMHFSRPILTSDRDFAHEVCGDGALYFEPTDVGSIMETIQTLRMDAGIRDSVSEAARTRYEQYSTSWDLIAEQALGEVRSMVG